MSAGRAAAPRPVGRATRVALAVNPRAGLGAERGLAAARAVLDALRPSELITNVTDLAGGPARTLPVGPAVGSRNQTHRVAEEAARRDVDLLVVIGGDGTLADAATTLFAQGSQVPILGVGSGSTNAGALVSCLAARLPELAVDRLVHAPLTALRVSYGAGRAALAFNDVVVATTICGTLDGEFTNLDAASHMRGEKRPGTPRPVAAPTARVSKTSGRGEVVIGCGAEVGSVVVGFSNTGGLFGQGLLGGLGLSAAADVPAGCLVATAPLVVAGFNAERHAAMEPLRSAYAGLSRDETVRLAGFGAGAILCADGNPLHAFEPQDVAEVILVPEACRSVRVLGEAAA